MRATASMMTAAILFSSTALAGDRVMEARQRAEAMASLKAAFPGATAYEVKSNAQTVYGRAMTTGQTPADSAAAFIRDHAAVFGVPAAELKPGGPVAGRLEQPLMYDPATGKYKFTLVYYSQSRDGLPVHQADLRLLVRNEPGSPVVLARSSLRDLGDFHPDRQGKVSITEAKAAVVARYPDLTSFTAAEDVIWAGENEDYPTPALGLRFQADNGIDYVTHPKKRSFVIDAATGRILSDENLIHHADILGTVSGLATQGTGADICGPEVSMPLPYPKIRSATDLVFGEADGSFVFPTPGTSPVKIYSAVRGHWFVTQNYQGASSEFFGNVTPPGPATFQHNMSNQEFTRAEVNGYISANTVRDFILGVNPAYPYIAAQTEMPVWVNRNDGYCPGNAWYDGSSINFCSAGSFSPNTAFSTVVYHEYGHHLVQVGGSGQGQYGEGMGDTVGMLITDEAGTGYGFSGNCSSPLRSADNSMQYPCDGEIHSCGRLISGAVWSTRDELAALYPDDYLSMLSNLAVNSILLHQGNLITPQIAIDYLTLDDDDADLENGTPLYEPVCAGFAAHNMDCPPRVLIRFDYPQGVPQFVQPQSGTTLHVNVQQSAFAPVAASGSLSYRVNGGTYSVIPMDEISPGQYEVNIPGAVCGDVVEFFVTVDTNGGPVTDPPGGAALPYKADIAQSLETVAQEDFEVAPEWSVGGAAATGAWELATPPELSGFGLPTSDFDGSGKCFITGGGDPVTLGSTELISPDFDLIPAASPRLRYARAFVNNGGSPGGSDVLQVDVSGDGGSTWIPLETVGPSGEDVLGGWVQKEFSLASILPGKSKVRIRFSINHGGTAPTTGAAIDAFSIRGVECGFGRAVQAAYPQNGPKTRYVTFVPEPGSLPVSYRVERLDGSGNRILVGWVGDPNGSGLSLVQTTATAPRVWTEPIVGVTGCPIVPNHQYVISATPDFVEYSGGLAVTTVPQPSDGRLWGDTVGVFDSETGQWLWPDGAVTGLDIVATLRASVGDPAAPPISWVDVHPQVPDRVVNGTDILQVVNAFRGVPYPFAQPEDCP